MSCPNATIAPSPGRNFSAAFTPSPGRNFSASFTPNCVPAVADSVLNRSEVDGLIAGDAPLAAVDLSALSDNAVIVITLDIADDHYTGRAQATYRRRAVGADSQTLPRLVVSAYSAAWLWELIGCHFTSATYQGTPCELNVSNGLLYPRYAQNVDGVAVSGLADFGFSLP